MHVQPQFQTSPACTRTTCTCTLYTYMYMACTCVQPLLIYFFRACTCIIVQYHYFSISPLLSKSYVWKIVSECIHVHVGTLCSRACVRIYMYIVHVYYSLNEIGFPIYTYIHVYIFTQKIKKEKTLCEKG